MRPSGIGQRSVARVLEELSAPAADGRGDRTVVPTGFHPLDQVLGGGLRPRDLVLLGGAPGVGKTIAALQMARHIAASGRTAVYACYEHDEHDLLTRLLLHEVGAVATPQQAPEVEKLRTVLAEVAAGQRRLIEAALEHPLLRDAQESVAGYAERLWLVPASGRHTDIEALEGLLADHGGERAALFVDYLQKVAVGTDLADEAERVTRVSAGLKDIALTHQVPVVAIVAADQPGLRARRLRLHHLRGSSALAYEADVVLTLNDKHRIVDDVHLDYDTGQAERFRHWAVATVEKNRGGQNLLDIELRKDFAHFRFDPEGRYVAERLVEERAAGS